MFQTFSFGPMDSLKEVNFYKDVDQINGSSFCNCYKLEKISFGGNVNYIGPGVFGSSKIQSYTVMEGNTALTVDSETGAMYNADKTRMFLPPAWDYEGEFVVPETVELTVGQFASAPYTCLNDGYNCGFNKNGTYYVSFMFAVGEAKEYKYKTTSIVLPENATVIPETCFYGLKGLQKINNVDKIERIDLGAFNFCGIEELVFTESLKQVGISPFKGMEKLKTLVLPDNLTFDRTYDFMKGCSALEEFTIPSGMNIIYATNMLNGAESLRKLTYHGTSTVIPSYMVYGGKSLETLEGFENVKTIESWAFAFSGLKEANFPSVTVVGNAAFGGCTQLERYTFNENITSMGTNAFADAQSLKEIYIGAKLRLDFSKVFLNLLSLETITVAEGNANYTSLDGALYNKALTTIIKYPTANKNVEYTVPETVTEIGAQVFIGVQKLEKITMNGVYVIGDYAFSQSGIKEVVAENLVKVGVEAFKDTALTQIDLRKVYYVDDDAFNGTQLKEIELDAFSVYGKHVFANIDTLEKVVLGDVDAFPFWASFYNSNNIKEIVIKDDCKTFAMENDYFMSADRKQIYRYFGNEEVIVIPENVAKIDAQAFINNLSVKEVVLPSTLKLIGAAAFYKCDNLEKVTFRSENAPRLEADYTEEYSLINCNFIDYVENMTAKLTVYVPEINDSYNTYLWNMYFNVLVAD